MAEIIKVSLKIVNLKVKASIHGQMENYFRDNGKAEYSMVMEYIKINK